MIEVFFDYTCGFSYRARHWLDALPDLEVCWRPFSLLEVNRGAEGPPVFERAEHAENVSLIALAVHEAVRADGGDLNSYRRRMFSAWHEEPGRLSTEDIVGLGRAAGLGRFDHDAAFAAVAAHHGGASELGVYGTPTLVHPDGVVAFVRLDAIPAADRARPLWETTRQLGQDAGGLREWHRVDPPQGVR